MKVVGGDFAVGESTGQHQKLLFVTAPGEWKRTPLVGINALRAVDDEGPEDLIREATRQMIKDGMTIESLTVNPAAFQNEEEVLFVNAKY